MVSARFVQALLYGVKATDWTVVAIPAARLLAKAIVAAVAPVLRAVRIDPVEMLRAE